jgi:2-(1,2-epoxy-1,2-dihydrophenyl)acetyl-CoA isomerase
VSDLVLLERAGAVATITLNRPEGMNALTVEAKVALLDAVQAVRDDVGVRALVLTGSGGPSASGRTCGSTRRCWRPGDDAPLSDGARALQPAGHDARRAADPDDRRDQRHAAGAGLGLACALDFRIGAPARATRRPSPASG